jgi:hypothetical protein
MTSSSGTAAIRQKSPAPNVGFRALVGVSVARSLRVDLLVPEAQRVLPRDEVYERMLGRFGG